MDSLKSLITDIRVFLYGGIRTLPLTLAGTMLILGLFTANYAIIFFLLGYLILAPVLAYWINLVAPPLTGLLGVDWFRVKSSDVCNVVIPYLGMDSMKSPQDTERTTIVMTSPWAAMITFFFGYILANGVQLFTFESEDTTFEVNTTLASDLQKKKGNRKTQAIVAVVSIVVIAVAVLGYRKFTSCETWGGLTISTVLFGSLGYGWYSLLSAVGASRLSDLFGIANRLLPPSAIANAPVACVPMP